MLELLAAALLWIAEPPPGVVRALVEHEATLFAGTEVGWLAAGPAGWGRTAVAAAVIDALASPEGLWVATEHGLWLWPTRGEPRRMGLGAGARLRGLALDAAGRVWVATESGVFVRGSGARSFEREASLPPGDVLAVRAAGPVVVAARAGTLWLRRGERFEVLAVGLGEGWWELRAAATWRGSLYLAVPRGLWRIEQADPERIDPGRGELRDLHASEAGLWLATARGVWRYDAVPGSPGALPEAALAAATTRLHWTGTRLLAATDRGVAALAPAERGDTSLAAPGPASLPSAPAIGDVQHAVLAYLDLEPAKFRELERSALRRGWLPQLRAGVSADRDRSRDSDRDEVISSSSIWRLHDRSDGRDHGLRADLDLVWDFGALAAPDDAIDISRERRLVVELRDQVLERVNRLYFERLRTGDALAAASDPAKRRELELRMAELTAQLDGWSGGAFSRLLVDSSRSDRREP